MSEPLCRDPACEYKYPHYHGWVYAPGGSSARAIVSIPADPRAEVRDPDTGEVIFPAVKGPLRVIEGGKPAPEAPTPADQSASEGTDAAQVERDKSRDENPHDPRS